MDILCLPVLSQGIMIQVNRQNTARYNDKREVNVTLTRSVHWGTKLFRLCRVKLVHHLTGQFQLCHS
jgi:hypothetical protein